MLMFPRGQALLQLFLRSRQLWWQACSTDLQAWVQLPESGAPAQPAWQTVA
jgi:hypothetical protein